MVAAYIVPWPVDVQMGTDRFLVMDRSGMPIGCLRLLESGIAMTSNVRYGMYCAVNFFFWKKKELYCVTREKNMDKKRRRTAHIWPLDHHRLYLQLMLHASLNPNSCVYVDARTEQKRKRKQVSHVVVTRKTERKEKRTDSVFLIRDRTRGTHVL